MVFPHLFKHGKDRIVAHFSLTAISRDVSQLLWLVHESET